MLRAIKTIGRRKEQLDKGIEFDPEKKSTLSLLADQNKLTKAIGEESLELGRAIALGEGEVGEAADLIWTVLVALESSDISPLSVFDELSKRNK